MPFHQNRALKCEMVQCMLSGAHVDLENLRPAEGIEGQLHGQLGPVF